MPTPTRPANYYPTSSPSSAGASPRMPTATTVTASAAAYPGPAPPWKPSTTNSSTHATTSSRSATSTRRRTRPDTAVLAPLPPRRPATEAHTRYFLSLVGPYTCRIPTHQQWQRGERPWSGSVSAVILVLLESLSPLERAVFVLHEVFGYPHEEIAGT